MRTAYKVLAYLVAAEVAIQAMVMVWAIAGLAKWVDGGGVFDKSVIESQGTPFPEVAGIIVHGINGTFVVPAIALLLLIVSFFTKVRGAIKRPSSCSFSRSRKARSASGHEFPLAGALHGSPPWCCSAWLSMPAVGYGLPYEVMFRTQEQVATAAAAARPSGRRSAHEDSARRCGDLDLRRRSSACRLSRSLRILWLKDTCPRSWACSRCTAVRGRHASSPEPSPLLALSSGDNPGRLVGLVVMAGQEIRRCS